jgi:hypothetical protein
VIPQHALSPPCIHQALYPIDDRRTVRSTVGEITYKRQTPSVRVRAVGSITQMPHQRPECLDLAVDITHDVERTVEQGLN